MEEKTVASSASAQQISAAEDTSAATPTRETTAQANAGPSAEKAGTGEKKAYGTAKTENLRDSGLWRTIVPILVIALCLVLVALPLIILVPLLYGSLSAPTGSVHNQLLWLWIPMILLELGIAAVIIRGLVKVFMTQAGNYSR